jgi:ATP-dependent protease HslVU (ClpYQ) peptidase subunit
MACDLQMTQSNTIKWKCKTKIYKFKAHQEVYAPCDFMVGFAGSAGDIVGIADYFEDPDSWKKPPKLSGDMNGLVLTQEGNIYIFQNPGRWLLVDAPYAACGSGSVFALGAVNAGASVKEAVKIASKLDPWSGMGVKQMSW